MIVFSEKCAGRQLRFFCAFASAIANRPCLDLDLHVLS